MNKSVNCCIYFLLWKTKPETILGNWGLDGKYSMYSINQIDINGFLCEKTSLKNKVQILQQS